MDFNTSANSNNKIIVRNSYSAEAEYKTNPNLYTLRETLKGENLTLPMRFNAIQEVVYRAEKEGIALKVFYLGKRKEIENNA